MFLFIGIKLMCIDELIFSVDISPSESFLRGGQNPTLTVHSAGHGLHVFVNGKLSGTLMNSIYSLCLKKIVPLSFSRCLKLIVPVPFWDIINGKISQ